MPRGDTKQNAEALRGLLEVPIQASLDPVGWSFAELFSHVGTKSIV